MVTVIFVSIHRFHGLTQMKNAGFNLWINSVSGYEAGATYREKQVAQRNR